MNYETTIRPGIMAEAADGIPAEIGASGRTDGPAIPRGVIFGGLGLLGLLLAIAAYFALSGGQPLPAGDDNSQAPVVTVITPGQTTIAGEIEAPGTLAARRPMPVGVAGEGGQVLRVLVDAGDWVKAGQVLAVIDRAVQTEQAAAQAAQVDVARADANIAQANLDRALQLVERGFVTQANVDQLTATRDAAVARVKVAEAQLRELRARNDRLNIYAPASGIVLERSVEPGQTVSSGSSALFRIASGGEMEVLAQLSEDQLASLPQGTPATIIPTGSAKEFSGQIWQIAPVIDQATRQGIARIALPWAPELRPGGFATARINSGAVTATILPESAVLADGEGSFVFIIDKDNKAVRRPIKTGMVTSRGIVITEGLTGSERVVLRAGGFLTAGETVKPQVAQP
ncbi:MAG: efflux RND transporter periplasmic adaptor subunit [Erythrobacter sp.]